MDSYMQMRYPNRYQLIAIFASTVANIFLGMNWYGNFFGKPWMRLIAEHKGIASAKDKKEITMKDFGDAIKTRWPYPEYYSYASSMICNLVKSWFIFHWFDALGISSLPDAVLLGMCWSTIHLVSVHQYFWQGKRIQLALIDFGYEVVGFLLTAIVVHQIPFMLHHYNTPEQKIDSFMQVRYPNGSQFTAIIFASIATFIFGMFYGVSMSKYSIPLIAEDKGILSANDKKEISMEEFAEAAKTRFPYPESYCAISSLLCNLVKSWFFFHWFAVLDVSSLLDALLLGSCLSTVHIVSVHQYFWGGRRIQLALIDQLNEWSCILVTAALVYQLA